MKYILIIFSLLVAGVIGFLFWNQQHTPFVYEPYVSNNLKTEINRWFSPAQVQEWEDKIRSTQEAIAKFGPETTVETRINTLFSLASQQEVIGKYSDAKKTLEQVLSIEVSHNVLQVYASLLAKMGDNKAAIKYIDGAIEMMPRETNLWRTKIDMERERLWPKNLSKLEEVFKKALQSTNNDINMVTLYASYLSELGRKEEAILYWEIAKKIYPANATLFEGEIEALRQQ